MRRNLAKEYKRKLGGYRRSPRLSATEGFKSQQPNKTRTEMAAAGDSQSPSRARKRRKLKPLKDVAAKSFKGNVKESFEDDPSLSDEPTGTPSATSCITNKLVLESVLDILQRRDTHELFAQPIDPEEVEGYHEIIKEPMDFGTMRAKLHEGMYSSLEQFERDVLLISRNAMEFNSSTTLYFRQARAIHELAKRVLHSLKTDPRAFEMENVHTRRRSSRRMLPGDARDSRSSSSSKISRNLKLNGKRSHELSNAKRYSGVSPNLGKSVISDSASLCGLNSFNCKVFSGGGNCGKERGSYETDRRFTYRPSISTVCNGSKQLIPVSRSSNIGYQESLKLFIKDLGPTACRIAERKSCCGWQAFDSLRDLSCAFPSRIANSDQFKVDKIMKETLTGDNLLCFSYSLCLVGDMNPLKDHIDIETPVYHSFETIGNVMQNRSDSNVGFEAAANMPEAGLVLNESKNGNGDAAALKNKSVLNQSWWANAPFPDSPKRNLVQNLNRKCLNPQEEDSRSSERVPKFRFDLAYLKTRLDRMGQDVFGDWCLEGTIRVKEAIQIGPRDQCSLIQPT